VQAVTAMRARAINARALRRGPAMACIGGIFGRGGPGSIRRPTNPHSGRVTYRAAWDALIGRRTGAWSWSVDWSQSFATIRDKVRLDGTLCLT
jgi:hypothetical protein